MRYNREITKNILRTIVVMFIALSSSGLMMAQSGVMINELMQSNIDFMMVNHDFPDSWVELYNGRDKTVDVNNYRIGPTNVYEEAYPLSSSAVELEPGAHLTLYCDKTTGTPFHYNFNLEAGKGKLFLFDDTGALVDSVIYKKMPAPNIAYGRVTDGSDEWQYELTPTPGAPNSSVGNGEVLPEPLFSVAGHLMTSGAETVTISMPEGVPEDTRIYLTTDGSEPTWASDNDTHFTINVDKSMVIRAKLLSSQMLPSRSTTHSYIFHPRETKLPIVCIATDDAFLYSREEGILSNDSTDGMPNYKYDWRRPANFEYFNTENGKTVFNQCGEMAVGGNYSRTMPQKSIKCYAKNRFGKKYFKGNFWRDKPDVTKVKSFMLRNGGTNCLNARIEDEAIQKFFGTNIDEIDWMAYEPVIVYINGVYKGIYGFRERSNEDNVASNHDIDDDEVEIASATEFVYPNKNTSFYDFYTLYHQNDVSYEEMAAAMNTENFMNVFIGECYASNTDYPHHNVKMWKQKGVGYKWNWILYDLDYVIAKDASWNMFKYMLGTDNPDDAEYTSSHVQKVVLSRCLYEKMMSFPEFRNRFLAAYATYLGDFLRPDVCKPIIWQMYNEIVDEIAPTFAAYNNMSTREKFTNRVDRLWTYVKERPAQVYKQMADYFALGDVIPVNIMSDEEGDRSISVCDTPLRTGMFQGKWFTQFPLCIEATDDSSTEWTMVVTHADGNESTYVYDTAKIQPTLALCSPGDSVTFFAIDASAIFVQNKVMINELMQSNIDFMMVNHDFPDSWVELYNGRDKTVDVNNYRIGPTNVYEEAYPLSSSAVELEPGAHLTLYCDKTTGTPFHYNFNLEAGKGKLFLFDDTGALVDSVIYKKMPAPNIAYGRVTDGSDEWQYELTPTPGASNNSVGSDEVLPEPLFSVEGHVMKNGPETVTVSMPEGVPEDTRIYLTLDGSEPTWESASDTHFTLNIDKSTVVRAKLLSHEMLPLRSTTHSYILHPRETKLPIVCIATDDPFLFSSEEGICSDDSTDGIPNYNYDWRRPANFEYFRTTADTTVFNQCGEMALAGGITRNRPQKSFKCYAKNRFGKKNFKGDFWHDKPEVTRAKSFMLRNGGNNCKSGRIEDAALQKFFGTNIDEIDWQAYEPVIVYINGIYKGVYGFRERSQEDYVASNYDIDDNEVDIATAEAYIKPDAEPCFSDFYALYHRNNVTYEEMAEAIDIDNFMNAFIAECYSSNTDYPRNNVSMWRQTGEGNKWHWILNDLDFVEDHNASWNMFKYMLGTDNPEDEEHASSNKSVITKARYLYVRMMRFPEFSNRFITKYATYLGDFLRPDVCLPIVNKMAEEIRDEITPTFATYNMSTLARHQYYVDLFCDYITQRPAIVYQQMADYFALGDVIPVNIMSDEEGDRSISVCDTPLRTGMFQGKWFTQFPLCIEATDDSSTEWTMVVTHADGNESTYVYDTAKIQPTLALCSPGDSVTFIATDAPIVDDIASTYINNHRSIAAIYDVTGKKIPATHRGVNIILYSDGTRRKVIMK